MHRFCQALRPSVLDDLGLIPLLAQTSAAISIAAGFAIGAGIKYCTLRHFVTTTEAPHCKKQPRVHRDLPLFDKEALFGV